MSAHSKAVLAEVRSLSFRSFALFITPFHLPVLYVSLVRVMGSADTSKWQQRFDESGREVVPDDAARVRARSVPVKRREERLRGRRTGAATSTKVSVVPRLEAVPCM